MKRQLKHSLILLFFITLNTSCGKSNNDICDPDQICYTQKPDELYIKVELSNNPNSEAIEVKLYKGYIDDGELYDTFFTTENTVYYLMPEGERYSVTAKYKDGNDYILVVDSEKLRSESYENCEETCYDWDEEIVLDLKLK
ncbi:hypothetical protein [Brumimicrobium oceani]|uniref:Uncharacterized protein n=1 Tax=Brumimicrobium oceani TaxID=2100725 RepID=A0A2U2X265_9FLAO|nr:hypothetical protein [Brumimicrobium oceani]PWH81875.1 hypothetical protein DIT68_14380 [Brumimicrobium oceani]